MDQLTLVQKIVVFSLPVLFAITVHETAHGWVAKKLGDPTAAMLGRLTLNPIKHIDPIGTILVPLLFLMLPGNFMFGWAKPVPVNWQNLRNPKRDMALVAVAGPLSNLLMAVFWALVLKGVVVLAIDSAVTEMLFYMAYAGVLFNLILMILNMLPIPPLDGGRVLAGVLPADMAMQFGRIEPFGVFIVIALLASGLLGKLMQPLLGGMLRLFGNIFGI